jgi:DNA adenine methylase
MGKYSCEKCAKTFSQKSHYDKHLTRKNPCEIQTDKIKELIDKAVEEKLNELNKKLISNHTESITANNTPKMELSKLSKKELLVECDKLGITKCKSKSKDEIIKLINSKNDNINNNSNNILLDTSPFIHTTNISPLRYPGGKTRACKIIDDIILQHFDITCFDTILSPFFGGGSFEFYLQNKYGLKLIVNDKFTPLYNFWKQVKVNKTILCEELRKIKLVSKEQFTSYRNTIMDLNDNILQQSIQYFIINRCSFSGSTLSGGFSEEASSKRFTPSSINKIEALDFTHIEIYNNDFYDFIINLTASKTLIFLDPPYYLESKSKLYGNNGDMHEGFNHQLLFDILNTKKNWIVTYNNCDYIRTLYKDYIIIDVNWSYGMNTSKTSSEIIIISK